MSSNLGTMKGAAVFHHIDRLFESRTNDVEYRGQTGQTESFVIAALPKIQEISQMRTSEALLRVLQQLDELVFPHLKSFEQTDHKKEDVKLLVCLAIVRSTTLVHQLFVDSLTQFYHTIESHAQFWNYEDSHPLHYILTSIPARLRKLHGRIVQGTSSPVSRRRSSAINPVASCCSEEHPLHTRITLNEIGEILRRTFTTFKEAGQKWFDVFRTPGKFRLFVREIFIHQVRENCGQLKELKKQVIGQLGQSYSMLVNLLQANTEEKLYGIAIQNITAPKALLPPSHLFSAPMIKLSHPDRTQPKQTMMRPTADAGQPFAPRSPPLQSSVRAMVATNTSSASVSPPQHLQVPHEMFSPTHSPPVSPSIPPLHLPSFSNEEPDSMVTIEELIEAFKQLIEMVEIVHNRETELAKLIATTRPSRTQWWLHLLTLGCAIYKGIRTGLAANLTKDKVKRYFRELSQYYWITYIGEPLQGIYTTLIRGKFEMPHLGPQSLQSEMELLKSMVLSYHRDHAFFGEFTETDQNRVEKILDEGDLGTINSDYEHCIKKPISAIMFGDMTRLLLIQLQHQKVNITRVYGTLDKVMKQNELNFHLMGFVPAVLLVLFIIYAYVTRKRISSQPVYKTIRVALWEVDRLLNRSSSSHQLDWCEQGYFVLELYKMRMVAGKIQGAGLRHCFLEDLAELEDANLTTQQRLHTLQRMYRIYWFLFPVKYRR